VGRVTAHDGHDHTEVVNQSLSLRAERDLIEQELKNATIRPSILDHWRVKKEGRQEWGIAEGMSREEVDQIAKEQGIQNSLSYSEAVKEPGKVGGRPDNLLYWVKEYYYKTGNFRHTKKVYFDGNEVHKVDHHSEKLPAALAQG